MVNIESKMMDFKQRKKIERMVTSYIKSEYTCIEHLLGLKIVIQALDVAIDRRLQSMLKQRDKLHSKLRVSSNENEWLD
jgi:hypothetical protein